MKPLKIEIPELPEYSDDEGVSIRCRHAATWPPPLMLLDVDVPTMWKTGEISQHDYQQIQTWERVCGLKKMGQKCMTCPLATIERTHAGTGKTELVGLVEALTKAKKTRARLTGRPRPATQPESEGQRVSAAVAARPPRAGVQKAPIQRPVKPESFEPDVEEFVDAGMGEAAEPDYPIAPEGTEKELTFEQPEPQEPQEPQEDEEEILDALLDGDE